MVKYLSFIPLAAVVALSASCSFVKEGRVNQPAIVSKAKSAYVVRHENSTRDIDKYLESALADKGLRVTSGPISAKPAGADIYVEYVDRWKWDMAMYLWSLDVFVRNNRNGELVATGNFHQGFPHSFPNPEQKSKEVVDTIFSPAPAR